MMKMKFGWLNDNSVVETNLIIIKPIADFDNAISEVMNSSQHNGTWYYPPIIYKKDKLSPRVTASRFELPPTHNILQIKGSDDSELLEFIVVLFGWLHGLRLNPENWGYLIKTPIKQGELVDFARPRDSDMKMLIEKAEVFWLNNKTNRMGNLMLGALNWFSYTQSYEQIFERFMGQYSVFDTLYHIVKVLRPPKKSIGHAERFRYVSDQLNLHYPSWIGEITKIRNELIHESKFAGRPIGFAANSDQADILLSLIAFNCRVIAALIGAEGNYSRSSCENKQTQGFDID